MTPTEAPADARTAGPRTDDPRTTDPRTAVEALAASREPYLLGIRHHSPALAALVRPTAAELSRRIRGARR